MPTTKHWIQRVVLPLGIAAFAAVMCAGPGTVLVPYTAQLAAPLICPPGTNLQHSEHPGTDSQGERVTYVNENCVGDDHMSQPAEGRIFGILGGIYFLVFGIVALTARFALNAAARRERTVKPLGVEELRRVQAMLDQGHRLDAIRLVRQLTGSSLAQAKKYVETLTAVPPQVK